MARVIGTMAVGMSMAMALLVSVAVLMNLAVADPPHGRGRNRGLDGWDSSGNRSHGRDRQVQHLHSRRRAGLIPSAQSLAQGGQAKDQEQAAAKAIEHSFTDAAADPLAGPHR